MGVRGSRNPSLNDHPPGPPIAQRLGHVQAGDAVAALNVRQVRLTRGIRPWPWAGTWGRCASASRWRAAWSNGGARCRGRLPTSTLDQGGIPRSNRRAARPWVGAGHARGGWPSLFCLKACARRIAGRESCRQRYPMRGRASVVAPPPKAALFVVCFCAAMRACHWRPAYRCGGWASGGNGDGC